MNQEKIESIINQLKILLKSKGVKDVLTDWFLNPQPKITFRWRDIELPFTLEIFYTEPVKILRLEVRITPSIRFSHEESIVSLNEDNLVSISELVYRFRLSIGEVKSLYKSDLKKIDDDFRYNLGVY